VLVGMKAELRECSVHAGGDCGAAIDDNEMVRNWLRLGLGGGSNWKYCCKGSEEDWDTHMFCSQRLSAAATDSGAVFESRTVLGLTDCSLAGLPEEEELRKCTGCASRIWG
jgi:hypothetical protein